MSRIQLPPLIPGSFAALAVVAWCWALGLLYSLNDPVRTTGVVTEVVGQSSTATRIYFAYRAKGVDYDSSHAVPLSAGYYAGQHIPVYYNGHSPALATISPIADRQRAFTLLVGGLVVALVSAWLVVVGRRRAHSLNRPTEATADSYKV